ncbi:MAG: hypothetical protein PHP17_05380 [Candidatus Omnitrophica bacterium]|nr:hypothetical protein [Candidatus Omnitrophota bacterium]
MNTYRKAQATLQYCLLIAALIGVVLTMQVYIKRSMQGKIKLAGDQLAEQYAVGETKLHEHFESNISTTEWMFPGPVNVSNSNGSFRFNSNKELEPLPAK